MKVTRRVKVFVALATLMENLDKVELVTLTDLAIPEGILDRIRVPLDLKVAKEVKVEMCKFGEKLSDNDVLASRMFYHHKDIDIETRDRMWAIYVSYKYLEKYKKDLGELWLTVVARNIPGLMEGIFYPV